MESTNRGGDLPDSARSRLKFTWDREYCAEHDGGIASFVRLTEKLDHLDNYEVIFKRETVNVPKWGSIVGGVVLGAAVFAPVAILAAPGMASAIGATGLLGAAGTGTAISTLSGAALGSASLAAIGGGTMAGGMLLLTAAGAALGAGMGGVVSNSYFGEVDGFAVRKLNEGSGTGLIFINGFLSEKEEDFRDWRTGAGAKFSRRDWYATHWEASNRLKIGKMLALDATGAAVKLYAQKLAARAAQKAASKFNPLTWAAVVADMAANPWHSAMVKASMTGILLADLMCRTAPRQYTLMGHSLGARVIAYALQALSTRTRRPVVRDVYLLGGAVDRRDGAMWKSAAKAVDGTIHNCYSQNDKVLQYAYRGANAMLSDPIGIGPILGDDKKIKNWDFSDLVDGHMVWKSCLGQIFELTATMPKKPRNVARRPKPSKKTRTVIKPADRIRQVTKRSRKSTK